MSEAAESVFWKRRKRTKMHGLMAQRCFWDPKVKLHKTFELSDGNEFENVVELQMETKHLESGKKQRFTLYLATYGDLRGVPVRIEDQPRWWLKVQLDLETESSMALDF